MNFVVDYTSINTILREELSREAATAVDKDGASLYDFLRPLSRDESDLSRYIADALSSLAAAFWDCYEGTASAVPEGGEEPVTTMTFYLPDMPSHNTSLAQAELQRYIILYVAASFLQEKNQEKAKAFAERANNALTKANHLMRKRTRI